VLSQVITVYYANVRASVSSDREFTSSVINGHASLHRVCIRYNMVYSGLYECNEYNAL